MYCFILSSLFIVSYVLTRFRWIVAYHIHVMLYTMVGAECIIRMILWTR